MALNYKFYEYDDEAYLTVYRAGTAPLLASRDTHSNFDELVRLAKAGDESVIDLFDTGLAIQRKFEDVVNGRVAIRNGLVYFDDDAMDNSITKAILAFHEQGENFTPLVKFMENVMANPQVESREQFYRYVDAYHLPIDDDGNVILYKGVYKNDDGAFYSTHAGHAFVNGVEYKNVRIPNRVGDVVTMPRSEVDFDPNSACSSGLHTGTHGYASSYGDTLMAIRVNPRDVVSVPHDVSSQKVRVCRYEVLDFADPDNEFKGARWVSPRSVGTDEVVENWVPADRNNVKVGSKVRRTDAQSAFLRSREARYMTVNEPYTVGKLGVSKWTNEVDWVHLAETPEGDSWGVWLNEIEVLVDDEKVDSSKSGVRDTRENHKYQKRDAKGHFVKQNKQ
jgi:hypothetical protein